MTIRELTNEKEINLWLKELDERGCNTIALDIEGEFNLHCYGEHLCLIQIFDGLESIIIDPLKLKKPEAYRKVFEKRELLKIMYDSASDASLMKNGYGIHIKSILDLRPAVSLLEFEKQSLSAALEQVLDIAPPNKKKFQMYNWMKRPIETQALEYAMGDVLHLYELKSELLKILDKKGLTDTFILRNLMAQNGEIKNNKIDRYKKAKGFRYLSGDKKELFKNEFNIRDEFARKLNRPPDYVFRNRDLLDFCKDHHDNPNFIDKGINARIEGKVREDLSTAMKKAAGIK
ncbi:MAG: 3'-5' exonuclease [Spirochaetales bacterium]|nr:3'-5' exonuclease [Spirochaetales bacterium]